MCDEQRIQKDELSDDELLEQTGLTGQEYAGLRKSFYERSAVIKSLRSLLKKSNEEVK